MIVRIVSYPDEDVDEATDRARECAPRLREAPGVEHAYFMFRENPAEAGAIVLFGSEDALDRYKESHAYRRAVEEIGNTWGRDHEPIREELYEMLDV